MPTFFRILLIFVWTCMTCGFILWVKTTVLKDSSDDTNSGGAGGLVVLVARREEHGDGFWCQMYTDKKLIQEALKTFGDDFVRRLTKEEMTVIRKKCNSFSHITIRKRRGAGCSNDNLESAEKALESAEKDTESAEEDSKTASEASKYVEDNSENAEEASESAEKDAEDNSENAEEASKSAEKEAKDNSEPAEDNLESVEMPSESAEEASECDSDPSDSSENDEAANFPIFPGTKWCGNGDIAANDSDLGTSKDTDKCCRAHDKCDDVIKAGKTKHNLTNNSSFTKLNCKCDDTLSKCLSKVNSLTSNTIGNMYFNLMKRECFQKDYPKTKKCKKYKFLKIKCVEYERDRTKPKVYEWVPAKVYKNPPVPGQPKLSGKSLKLLRQMLPST